jgi:signal transduction histidine kinase
MKDQASTGAVPNAGSRDHRYAELETRAAQVAVAVGSGAPLKHVLRMVRDAVVEVGGFDRGGVMLYDGRRDSLADYWGTTPAGEPQPHDGALRTVPTDARHPVFAVIRGGADVASVADATRELELRPEDDMYGLKAIAAAGLKLGDELVGVLWVDNLISARPIAKEDLDWLAEAARQFSVAVLAARVASLRTQHVALARRLTRFGELIASEAELDAVLRDLRDAVTETHPLDRAAIYIRLPNTNRFMGTWGTARDGSVEDLHDQELQIPEEPDAPMNRLIRGEIPYVLEEDHTALHRLGPDNPMYGVRAHCVLAMRAGDATVGLMVGDNLLTGAPITEEDIVALLPFAEHAALAVRLSRLQSQLAARVAQLRRLGRIASAITANSELSEMLRMVRDGIVESGLFDRAGVWLHDPDTGMIRGAWGTDRQGRLEDLRDVEVPLDAESPVPLHRVLRSEVPYLLTEDSSALGPEHTPAHMRNVRAHAAVAMRAGERSIGAITVDNLLTGRPITADDVELLIPFVEQAAAAVLNSRLIARVEQTNCELEQRVRERTQRLEAVTNELGAFLYALSHDLKAPARAAHGFASAVLEQYRDLLPPDALRDLERVRAAARRLGAQIEALLALARLGQSTLARVTVHPERLAAEAVRELRSQFPHAADIKIGDMPSCKADPDLLRLALSSLIKNALQATMDATLAVIEIGYEDGAYYVRDNGIGFDQAYAHTLFDLFRRYRPVEESEGQGFGLAFVRRVVEMHGGRVWAEGEPGRGATFRFTIGPGDAVSTPSPPGVVTRAEAVALPEGGP